jgi:Tol biopolymer transport system component
VGAFAEPVRNRMVLPIDLPDEKILALIKHELTHIFEYEILFQGRYDRALRFRPPTWVMEGIASFMAEDEDTSDRAVLRDAVVNDMIPSVGLNFGGFFAYRFGHEVFRYMVAKYGWDGLRDFIFEYRNSPGPSIERPLKRAFNVTIEDFDVDLRLWLRKRYLPVLIEKGEPQEFGRIFRTDRDVYSVETSPAAAPSGDLLVAFTTYREDVDVALYNVRKRELIRNLSKGLPQKYEYIVGQGLTSGPVAGRDVAFAPNGDEIAVFVKKGKGRALMRMNAINGRIIEMLPIEEVEQKLSPAYSADGRSIAFHGFRGNKADIYMYEFETGKLTNLTDDAFFDAAPVFSPDGKWLFYSSVHEGYSKIFRLNLADPTERYQVTGGSWNDIDAAFSPDGKRLFYASDRLTPMTRVILDEEEEKQEAGDEEERFGLPRPGKFAAYNIYSLDLASGEILQYTDVVGGSTTPQVVIGEENKEKLIFASYYKGRSRLYIRDTDDPVRVAEVAPIASEPVLERAEFIPAIEVELDPENERDGDDRKFFIEDVQVNVGVNSDQTFLSRSYLFLSDMLGNRRIIIALDTVSTFANFDFLYINQKNRQNWGVRLYDTNTYYATVDERGEFDRRQAYKETGLVGFLSYPFDRNRRVEYGGGYLLREVSYPFRTVDPDTGEEGIDFFDVRDDFPLVFASLSGDNTHFREFGPVAGRRYRFSSLYAYDREEGGTLTADFTLDSRHYLQVSRRSLLAARLFAGYSTGTLPSLYYFGGLDTLRGYPFRSIVGQQAFYANFEYRFPIVNRVDIEFLPAIRSVRGQVFFDIGAARFEDQPNWKFWEDGKLKDGYASIGWGITVNFLGLDLHWDFARQTDLNDIDSKVRTEFWIGQTF